MTFHELPSVYQTDRCNGRRMARLGVKFVGLKRRFRKRFSFVVRC